MGRKHYHVLCGLRGCYMPDNNDVYRSKRAAISGAAQYAKFWNDADYGADTGQLMVRQRGASGFYLSKHHVIEVTGPCFDDCDREE